MRRRADATTGALVGALAGLGCLTRTWGLAAAAALVAGAALHAVAERSARTRRFAIAVAAVTAALVVPWLVTKTVVHGSPFSFNGDPGKQSDPDQWRSTGQPASFFLSLDVREALTTPYQPFFRNHLLPTVYTDWFGDYWRSYDVPGALKDEPDRLPGRWEDPLARQSWAGLVVSTFTLVGAVGLARRAVNRRDVALGTVLLSAALLVVTFVAFLVRYPKQDGDTIKALYLLNAAPVVALCLAWGVSALAGRSRYLTVGLVAVLSAAALTTVSFLLLTPAP